LIEMVTKRLLALPLVVVGLVVIAACSSSSGSSSPNKTPGQCVLSNGTWYCGQGSGNWQDCVWDAGNLIGAPCDNEGAVCFSCYYESAGLICSCSAGDAGGLTWHCPYPSGTGCMSQ
jgi:hypothetical protein